MAVALLAVPAAGTAAAHGETSGPPATTIPVVLAVEPAVPGLAVTVIEGGARLRLDNGTGQTVRVQPPPQAPEGGGPVVPPGTSAAWADDRPATAAGGWTIPLVVDGQRVVVRGDLARPDPPAPAPWWALTIAAALGTFWLGGTAVQAGPTRRRRAAELGVAGVSVVVVGAHLLHVIGAALVAAAPATAATVLAAAGLGVAAWLLGLAGAGLVAARQPLGLPTCAAAGGLVALLTGFDSAGYARAVLVSGWPFDLDRALTVLAFGGGVGLVLTGWAALSHAAVPTEEPVAAR